MADPFLTFLLEKLIQQLEQEANLLLGVEDEVDSFQRNLKLINSYVRGFEGKRNMHDLVECWVNQMRELAFKAEDVIDTFFVDIEEHRNRSTVGKLVHGLGHLANCHSVATEIQKIKYNMEEHLKYIEKLHIPMAEGNGDTQLERSLHRRRTEVEEEDVRGFVNETNELVKQLIGGKSQRDVVSVIGMGGLGKTTLAKKIYNDISVRNHFSRRAWIYVSQEYRTRELLVGILKCVMQTVEERRVLPLSRSLLAPPIEPIEPITRWGLSNIMSAIARVFRMPTWYSEHVGQLQSTGNGESGIETINLQEIHDMSDGELKDTLFKCLKRRKYLIVMDDVWRTELWDEVKASFPDDLNGSRIMITSRIKKVALHASPKQPHFLPFLNKTESWELFSKKVFRGESCPRDLEDLGKQMAEICGGLPLSIVVLGGLLATIERTHQRWSRMVTHVKLSLAGDDAGCLDILALSYDNLPRCLKLCFMYIGAFPEDFEIPARELIRLWIAEGFIQPTSGRNMEDVAEEYLEELIGRSLIQVARMRADGGVKTCRIHDLLRELCISEAKRNMFLEVRMNVNPSQSKPRRVSIYCSTPPYITSNDCHSSLVHSLLYFGQDTSHRSTDPWKSLCKGFKSVRVLDLGSIVIRKVPDNIKKLIHLRYLKMKAPSLAEFPHILCNLRYLQTLDMRQSCVVSLPNGIWKMQQLRHLYLSGPTALPSSLETSNETPWNVQTLSTVNPSQYFLDFMVKGKFPNLKKLGFWSNNKDQNPELWMSISKLHNLQTLKIIRASDFTIWPDRFPSRLTKITLVEMVLSYQQMEWLQHAQNLRILKLQLVSFEGLKFDCLEVGFPKLEVLQMVESNISQWEMKMGALTNLRRLVIKKCFDLRELPNELWRLTNLEDVKVFWASSKLARSLQRLEMKEGRSILIYPPPSGHS